MKRKLLYIAAAIVGLLIALILVAASYWPVINVVETGKTPEYADVVPQYYSADDPLRVYDEAVAGAGAIQRWEVVESDRTKFTVKATRTTRVGFVDDIIITIVPVTEFATEVNVRSASRVGKGDFGQNARNIKEFFAELDKRLGALKFDPASQQKDPKSADENPKKE